MSIKFQDHYMTQHGSCTDEKIWNTNDARQRKDSLNPKKKDQTDKDHINKEKVKVQGTKL